MFSPTRTELRQAASPNNRDGRSGGLNAPEIRQYLADQGLDTHVGLGHLALRKHLRDHLLLLDNRDPNVVTLPGMETNDDDEISDDTYSPERIRTACRTTGDPVDYAGGGLDMYHLKKLIELNGPFATLKGDPNLVRCEAVQAACMRVLDAFLERNQGRRRLRRAPLAERTGASEYHRDNAPAAVRVLLTPSSESRLLDEGRFNELIPGVELGILDDPDLVWGEICREHREQGDEKFGCSTRSFTADNDYKVETTPEKEYLFAADPEEYDRRYPNPDDALKAYGDGAQQRTKDEVQSRLDWHRGDRRQVELRRLDVSGIGANKRLRNRRPEDLVKDEEGLNALTALLNDSLHANRANFRDHRLSRDDVGNMKLTKADVLMLILYTSPMFEVYNIVTRAMGREDAEHKGVIPFGVLLSTNSDLNRVYENKLDPAGSPLVDSAGQPLKCPYFRYSLHVLDRAIRKLQKGQKLPFQKLYRGLRNMTLPASVLEPTDGHRVWADFCPQSFSLDRKIALDVYGLLHGDADFAIVLSMDTNRTARGAFLGFISQYPWEKELVLPPLTQLSISREEQIELLHLNIGDRITAANGEQAAVNVRCRKALWLGCHMTATPDYAESERQVQEIRKLVEQNRIALGQLENFRMRIRERQLEEIFDGLVLTDPP
jgi:hypothetical protein